MFSPRIRHFLRMQRIAMALAGMTFGLLISVFSNWLSAQGIAWLPWVIGVAIVSGGVSAVYFLRQSIGIEVAIQSPRTIRTPEEARRYGRRGFIGFVSLYKPHAGTAAAALSPQERRQAVDALDFDRLQLEASNFRPIIEAIFSHKSELEHCWLLTTKGQQTPGSSPYAPLLVAYLRERKGIRCKFHHGEAYTISLDDDALIFSKTYDQVQRILKQTERLKIASQELVADITGGVRSMTLGMILACLNGDRDVEFVGTRYDERGEPAGDPFPIIFSFEPLLE